MFGYGSYLSPYKLDKYKRSVPGIWRLKLFLVEGFTLVSDPIWSYYTTITSLVNHNESQPTRSVNLCRSAPASPTGWFVPMLVIKYLFLVSTLRRCLDCDLTYHIPGFHPDIPNHTISADLVARLTHLIRRTGLPLVLPGKALDSFQYLTTLKR